MCTWIERLNIVKMSVFPKLIYRFNAVLTKISASFILNLDKLILKFIGKGKTRISKTVLKKKQSWRIHTT